jgi:(p)ppGpp synthase/HD superfamily hydrolase
MDLLDKLMKVQSARQLEYHFDQAEYAESPIGGQRCTLVPDQPTESSRPVPHDARGDDRDDRGELGRGTAEIATCEANIINVPMDNEPNRAATIRFMLQICSRQHLAQVSRQVRTQPDVTKVARL